MTINLSMPVNHELRPRISVVGVGGAGTNAVNNMITAHLEGVEFLACNTDAQSLAQSLTERRIQLGTSITQGLGAGARPEIGRAAAEEAVDELLDQLQSSHMVFITAGMGGGTGTGAAPVIARAVREQGILTVGVVTKPFHFEVLIARIGREIERSRSLGRLLHDNAALDARIVGRAIELGEMRERWLETQAELRRLKQMVGEA